MNSSYENRAITSITRAEARKRLLLVERKVRQVQPDRFNFGQWVGSDWGGKPNLSCGTNACAMGWATTIPYLRRLGLYLKRLKGTALPGDYAYPAISQDEEATDDTLGEFFGLTGDEFRYLFIPSYSDTTMRATSGLGERATNIQVADHIRHFVDFRFPEFAEHPAWPVRRVKE